MKTKQGEKNVETQNFYKSNAHSKNNALKGKHSLTCI